MKICLRTIYSGRVQGVGFRYTAKQIATGFDVAGWVRNLPDGTVEMLAYGESSEVDGFTAAIASSHLGGHIKNALRDSPAHPDPVPSGFEVRH